VAEQRALAGTQEKKMSLCPLEEGAGYLGGLEGYSEVIQGGKAQLELILATAVNNNKKS